MSRKHRSSQQIGKRETCFIPKPNKVALLGVLFRHHKRELIKRGIIEDPACRPARYKFTWVYGALNGVVYSDDRSTARSLIKRELGIQKKKRLPIEVQINQDINVEEPNEDSAESTGEGSSGSN